MATEYMTCDIDDPATATDNGDTHTRGPDITLWLPDEFITVFDSFMAASTAPSSMTSASIPLPTPVQPPNGDFLALNVYSDDQCQQLVGGYRGQDIDNKCVQLASAVSSYQFVWEGDYCGLDSGYTTCEIYATAGCIESGTVVDVGCGDDQSCQKTYGGSGHYIGLAQRTAVNARIGNSTFV